MRFRLARGLFVSGLGLIALACSAGDLNLPSAADPVQLTAESGGGQVAWVGSRLPEPLVVLVTNEAREPVPDVPLVFRFQDEMPDARITPSSILTDSAGRASVRVRLGTATGAHTIEVLIAAEAAPDARATFGVTALERRGGGRGGDGPGDDDEDEDDDED